MATNLSNQPDPLQELEKKIAKFPCKIISIFELRSNNINYSKEEKEGIAQTYWTTDNQESPLSGGLKDCFSPPLPPRLRLIVRSVLRLVENLGRSMPEFPRGTPTPTSKSTPTPRTSALSISFRIGASKGGKFQPRHGLDKIDQGGEVLDYRARGGWSSFGIQSRPPMGRGMGILISRIDREIGRENGEINAESDCYSAVVLRKKRSVHELKTRIVLDCLPIVGIRRDKIIFGVQSWNLIDNFVFELNICSTLWIIRDASNVKLIESINC